MLIVAREKLRAAGSRAEYPPGSSPHAQAIAATERIYTSRVFPAVKVTWGTSETHIGHPRFTRLLPPSRRTTQDGGGTSD